MVYFSVIIIHITNYIFFGYFPYLCIFVLCTICNYVVSIKCIVLDKKSVSNGIPCASLLFSWTSHHQLELDGAGSLVNHFYFLTDRNITRVMFLRSSQTLTVWKFTSVASVMFSGSNSVRIKWRGDLKKYHKRGKCDISGSIPQSKVPRRGTDLQQRSEQLVTLKQHRQRSSSQLFLQGIIHHGGVHWIRRV